MSQNVFKQDRMDFLSIRLKETGKPHIVHVSEEDGFVWGNPTNKERRIRDEVYNKLKTAKSLLPDRMTFIVFETYRPLSLQIFYWNQMLKDIDSKYPDLPEQDRVALCESFVANPYNGIGSGHQAACAVDISLCHLDGTQLDMGCQYHQFDEFTQYNAKGIAQGQKENRSLLKAKLEEVGLINDPAEWWHYSYGDHQWAWLTKKTEAFFGPLDLS